MEEINVDYDVVTEIAGHQPNKQVPIIEAARDIFNRVKENGMQMAVKGLFQSFETIDELQKILLNSVKNGYKIKVYDELIQG